MKEIEAPKANPENLLDIIRDSFRGKVVVPEFQRSFVWARDNIEEFLASILHGYFVGTFLVLDTSTEKPMFPFRTVEGQQHVNPNSSPNQHSSIRLVLDGQQRISSIFYALYQPDLPLRGAKNPYKFYLSLEPALEGEFEDAVIGVSIRDRRRLSENERLVKAHKSLPMPLFLDGSAFHKWIYKEQQIWDEKQVEKIRMIHARFSNFLVPVVSLSSDTGEDNIVNIFERINRTGIKLSLFDLAGARLYPKKVRLRDLWGNFKQRNPDVAETVKPESILKVIALLQGKEPRKGNLLSVIDTLDKPSFEDRWHHTLNAIVRAHARIRLNYGAFDERWTPYSTMIVPLAAMVHDLEKGGATEESYRKIDRWYWASVFGQRYDSAVDTKTFQDVRDLRTWIASNTIPEWIQRFKIDEQDLQTDEPRSAVYRGMMCLLVKEGCKDFLTGQSAQLHECQDDHIFPRSQYKDAHPVDMILNRSLISKNTNERRKGSKHPSEFIQYFIDGHGGDEARLQATLRSHFISQQAYQYLRNNDFESFVSERARELHKAAQGALNGELPKSG